MSDRAFTILVTGSRDVVPEHAPQMTDVLMEVADGNGHPVTLLHGDARGADRIAGIIGRTLGWHVVATGAEWKKYGKAAGHIRNVRMLQIGKPDIVVAFPLDGKANKGTSDCILEARLRNVPVEEVMLPKEQG